MRPQRWALANKSNNRGSRKQMQQRELYLGPALVKDGSVVEIPVEEFGRCRDAIDAAWIGLRWRGYKPTDRELSDALRERGVPTSPGQLNLILNRGGSSGRVRNPPAGFWEAVEDISGTDFMQKYLLSRSLKRAKRAIGRRQEDQAAVGQVAA